MFNIIKGTRETDEVHIVWNEQRQITRAGFYSYMRPLGWLASALSHPVLFVFSGLPILLISLFRGTIVRNHWTKPYHSARDHVLCYNTTWEVALWGPLEEDTTVLYQNFIIVRLYNVLQGSGSVLLPLDSSSGVVRMWVRNPGNQVTLVSLSKTLNHNCFVLRMGRKAVGSVCCVMHVKEPRTLILKEKGLARCFWICALSTQQGGYVRAANLLYYYYY